VPEEYYPQVQHQLMITGADYCIFAGYLEMRGVSTVDETNVAEIIVMPDPVYIKRLAKEEFDFWFELEQRRSRLTYKGELE